MSDTTKVISVKISQTELRGLTRAAATETAKKGERIHMSALVRKLIQRFLKRAA